MRCMNPLGRADSSSKTIYVVYLSVTAKTRSNINVLMLFDLSTPTDADSFR